MLRRETDLTAELLGYDREHLWHPYASMIAPTNVRLVDSASGVRLRLSDGREVVDAMASWWSAIHGYRHPVLDEAVRRQLDSMAHVMFGGLTHEPAVDLARLLVEITPAPLRHVFFADSGSVSVEVALKMAVQYQRGRDRPGRTKMLALLGGYHGDTAGAMAVTDPVSGMHTMFRDVLTPHVFAPCPPAGFGVDIGDWEQQTRDLTAQHTDTLAGIICEPVLQGAGGMHIYDPACLRVLRDLADEHELVLVFDEIATGFGRTGELFAADHAGVTPDVLCLGKALTGGYVTLAVALCTAEIAAGVDSSESGVLMHGPTFMANALACAVAAANIRMLIGRDWRADIHRLEAGMRRALGPATDMPAVRDVRLLGGVGVIQLERPVDVRRATAAALDLGVWIRPFRDLVYAMPPYVVTEAEAALIGAALVAAARA